MMRSSVVLPQPEGPSRATNSPSCDGERHLLQGAEGAEFLDDAIDDDVSHGTIRYLLAMPHTANRYLLTAKMKSTEGMMRMKPPAKR